MKKILNGLGILLVVAGLIFGIGYWFLYSNGYSGKLKNKDPKDEQIKVACVGDSITYGHGISKWAKSNYPYVLGEILGDDYCVHNYGVSGSTLQYTPEEAYVNTEVFQESLEFEADILVFMLGTNDSKPENWKGIEEFKADYIKLLNEYIVVNPSVEIYLCTPAVALDSDKETQTTNFDIQPCYVDEIAQFIRDYAALNDYSLIDINEITRKTPSYISADNIHPNYVGAAAIAAEVYNSIKE